ncbi:MAG: hypothetical protein V9F01_03425 [Chitinophagaceae bacterium]
MVNKAKAISDYLDLYINSRLKIREAYDRKYDTLPQIKTEVENLRITDRRKLYERPGDDNPVAERGI